jgi:SAM-dependent methyltransferase
MDLPCTYEDFRDCLRDVTKINRITFGYRPTLRWLDGLKIAPETTLHIVDVGCGDGEMLRIIDHWGRHRRFALKLTGIDLNPFAIAAARERSRTGDRIEWVAADAFSYRPEIAIDVVISSLFTHHLTDPEVVAFLSWMETNARRGWFINDLHREPVPYHLAKLLVRAMRFHRFVINDAPLSVARSFRPEDWKKLCKTAALQTDELSIQAWRPARLCVGRIK